MSACELVCSLLFQAPDPSSFRPRQIWAMNDVSTPLMRKFCPLVLKTMALTYDEGFGR